MGIDVAFDEMRLTGYHISFFSSSFPLLLSVTVRWVHPSLNLASCVSTMRREAAKLGYRTRYRTRLIQIPRALLGRYCGLAPLEAYHHTHNHGLTWLSQYIV